MYIVNNLGWDEDAGRFSNHYQPVEESITDPVTYIGGWMIALINLEGIVISFNREEQEDGTIVYYATAASDGRFISALYLRGVSPWAAV